jgi:iron complex transport system substrate-binding protein
MPPDPPRIVSLLPSATEIVCALDLADFLVGVTHACDYPPEAVGKPVVTRPLLDLAGRSSAEIDQAIHDASETSTGGVYALDEALLASLKPGLILTQALCEVCAVSHAVVQAALPSLPGKPRVLSLSPTRLADVLNDVKTVGDFTGRSKRARRVQTDLRTIVDRVALSVARATYLPRVVCLEWLDPPWLAGHWIPEMVGLAGGLDVLTTPGLPSRRATWEEIAAARPEVIVLMPCGFGLDATLREAAAVTWPAVWPSLPAVRSGRVWAVDASSYFNRPGPRIYNGLEILARIIQPEAMGGEPAPDQAAHLDHLAARSQSRA